MTDDRSQQKDQGLSNLSVDPELLARELAASRLAEEEKRLAVDQILMDAANQFE